MGNLLDLVKGSFVDKPNSPILLASRDYLEMARDISAAMEFVASKNIIHRDLACRVCSFYLFVARDFL